MTKNSTVIIGGTGLVGEPTRKLLEENGVKVSATSIEDFDITDKKAVEEFVAGTQAGSIILMAAYTNVEGAQKEPKMVMNINCDGVRNVAISCKNYGKYLVSISTDFVFEGTKDVPGPYKEEAKTVSVNSTKIGEYARSKLAGEKAAREVNGKHAIVRISYPFGNKGQPGDWVNRILEYIDKGWDLFEDQIHTPTYIPDLSLALKEIISRELQGIFHVATHPPVTIYEFGVYLAGKTGRKKPGKNKLEDFMKGRTPKPIKGGLDTTKTQKELGLEFHSWKVAVDKVLSDTG